MIMGVAAVGHGGPTPKPRCVPAHSPFPQLFTATVAQIETNPSGNSRVNVKSGHRQSPGRRGWLVIMEVWSLGRPVSRDHVLG